MDAGGTLPGDKGQVPTNPLSLPSRTFRLGTGKEGVGLDALGAWAAADLHVGHQNPTTSISFPFRAHPWHSGESRVGGRGLQAA